MVVDGIRSSQASNGSLILQETKTSDAGWYLCRAANSVGKPISKVVQLTVHGECTVVYHTVSLGKCLPLASSLLPHKILVISFYHFSLHSPFPLLLTAPARVVTEGGRVTGHAGQVVTVTCEATGDDPLTLTWLRHHAPVAPGITYVFPHLLCTCTGTLCIMYIVGVYIFIIIILS